MSLMLVVSAASYACSECGHHKASKKQVHAKNNTKQTEAVNTKAVNTNATNPQQNI